MPSDKSQAPSAFVYSHVLDVMLDGLTVRMHGAWYDLRHGAPVLYEAAAWNNDTIIALVTPKPIVQPDGPSTPYLQRFWSPGHENFRASMVQPEFASLLSRAREEIRAGRAVTVHSSLADMTEAEFQTAFANSRWYTAELLAHDLLRYAPGNEVPSSGMFADFSENMKRRVA